MINTSIMRPFLSLGNMKFWRFILGCRVVCGQFFIPNIWQFNIVLVNYIFAPYKWWNAMLSLINVKNLNIYHDSCA
jgi:hypothetical protein